MRSPLDLRDSAFLESLLGRPLRPLLGPSERAAIAGTRVLVTGAGGSVGSELARQLAACAPLGLTLVDCSEYGLFRIERELRDRWPELDVRAALLDVTRAAAARRCITAAAPAIVYHAAAYKHVSMMERDVVSAVRTNVLGSLNVARAAWGCGARFVLVSSDKAANARSVMGASKRMAELAVHAESGPRDRAAIVRFGNILGSSGSVLELMVERVRRGEPVQVTDPRATRYFMTPAEAVSLVIRAGQLGRTGEILWLDMGEPLSILELAQRLIEHARNAGMRAVPVEFTGLRPGEKLREELTEQGLELVRTEASRIWVARQNLFDRAAARAAVAALRGVVAAGDAERALEILEGAVPEYEPSDEARACARAASPSARRRERERAAISPGAGARRSRRARVIAAGLS